MGWLSEMETTSFGRSLNSLGFLSIGSTYTEWQGIFFFFVSFFLAIPKPRKMEKSATYGDA